ncbi:MAG: flagellar hook-basal body complex protein, partial [Clostridia bacterium]|nr:flagellar hook-basal body complex protein [Clostridia bacterium]
MAQSLYTAAAGLQAQQRNIDTIANNIANVNTDGYRKSRVEFQEAVYSAMLDPSLPLDGQTADLQRGSGVLAAVQTTLLDPGPLLQTGEPLDLAIGGDGYYMVEGTDGET